MARLCVPHIDVLQEIRAAEKTSTLLYIDNTCRGFWWSLLSHFSLQSLADAS
jgi:hypothetical protein